MKPIVLVISDTNSENWYDICKDHADEFTIEQRRWDEIGLCSYSDQKGAMVTLYTPTQGRALPEQKQRTISPSLVLVRNCVRYIGSRLGQTPDFRNILYGFYHGNVPMINGINAIIAEEERPLMFGRMRAIRDRVGQDAFPLVTQHYYPEHGQVICPSPVPYVMKIGYPHAGYGKIRVRDEQDTPDLVSVLAIHNDYVATEPFIDSEYELRIAYIKPNYYRVHKRSSLNWKVNFGMPNFREDVDITPSWKRWVDLIVETYPDMDTFCIDAIIDKSGKEYILEVNGSSQGFTPEHEQEDLEHMKNLVIDRLREVTATKPTPIDIKTEPSDLQIVNLRNKSEHLAAVNKEKKDEIVSLKQQLRALKDELEPTQQSHFNGEVLAVGVIFVMAFLLINYFR